jgi:hypothetical protein
LVWFCFYTFLEAKEVVGMTGVCIPAAYWYSLSPVLKTATNADKSKSHLDDLISSHLDGLITGTPDDHVEETVKYLLKVQQN